MVVNVLFVKVAIVVVVKLVVLLAGSVVPVVI